MSSTIYYLKLNQIMMSIKAVFLDVVFFWSKTTQPFGT